MSGDGSRGAGTGARSGSTGRRRAWWPRWRLTLRDTLIFSAPAVVLLIYTLGVAFSDYSRARRYDDWWSARTRVPSLFTAQISTALHIPRSVALKGRIDPEAPDPGIIRLLVDREAWENAERQPAATDDPWVEATLIDGEDRIQVELRRRGDTSVHWTTPKLSFTLKTPRNSLFRGFRRAGFSGKEVLPAFLANRLPAELGVFSTYTTVVPVFLNDQFYGVFRFVELAEESFLRRMGELPGNVYRADAAERGEAFKYLPRNVFVNPYVWERTVENDVAGIPADSALLELLDAIAGTTINDHVRLMGLVDRDEIARLVAALLVVGDPYHMSGVHNQNWYEDPSTGSLHPIPWDLRLLDLSRPQGRINNHFLRAALRDPFVVDGALEAVREWTADGRLLRLAEGLTRGVYERYRPHFDYDRLRDELISSVGTPDEVLTQLAANLATLDRWIADSRARVVSTPADADLLVIDVETAGYAGVELTGVHLTAGGRSPGRTGAIRLHADRDLNGVLDPTDPILPGSWEIEGDGPRLRLEQSETLLAGWSTDAPGITPGRVHYRFFLSGPGAGASPTDVRPELRNRFDGREAELIDWEEETPIAAGRSWSPWAFRASEPGIQRLAGSVRLAADLHVSAGGRLIIEPGTVVQLDPDVSIAAYGQVEARGTPDRPIRFRQAVAGRPWGALVLQGAGANGSVFEHVEFTGGGGARLGRVEYKGMVSVHRARSVHFLNARFADNLRSDDALNAVHAEVTLRRCEFSRVVGDAVDYDYSSGTIEDCRFEGSRNDAIDLMTSSPRIIGNRITGSGDKGISIGEDSEPVIFDNLIADCTRGIEVKDGSRPLLAHNRITGSEVGIFQQVKNWRYGAGGWAMLFYSDVSGNVVDYRADERSRLTAFATRIGDSATPTEGPSEIADPPEWLYARLGVIGGSHETGLLGQWLATAREGPVEQLSVRESLEGAPEWGASGGVYRVSARDHTLNAWLERRPGSITKGVDWALDDGRRYQAVVEVGGRDLASVDVVFTADGNDVRRALPVADQPGAFHAVTIDLPAGRYRAVSFEATASPEARRIDPRTGLTEVRGGRLEVRQVAVYALPQAARPARAGGG